MMTAREKHLSLALDALVQAQDTLDQYEADMSNGCYWTVHRWLRVANGHIEAAAMPKPSMIRRWFGKREAA